MARISQPLIETFGNSVAHREMLGFIEQPYKGQKRDMKLSLPPLTSVTLSYSRDLLAGDVFPQILLCYLDKSVIHLSVEINVTITLASSLSSLDEALSLVSNVTSLMSWPSPSGKFYL